LAPFANVGDGESSSAGIALPVLYVLYLPFVWSPNTDVPHPHRAELVVFGNRHEFNSTNVRSGREKVICINCYAHKKL